MTNITKRRIVIVVLLLLIFWSIFMGNRTSRLVVTAIEKEDTLKALELIEKANTEELNKPSYNKCFEFILSRIESGGDYPIIAASRLGNMDVVEALIKKNVDINVVDNYSNTTALIEALNSHQLNKSNYVVGKILIDNGADVDLIDREGRRAIDGILYLNQFMEDNKEIMAMRKEVILKIFHNSVYLKDKEYNGDVIDVLKSQGDESLLKEIEEIPYVQI